MLLYSSSPKAFKHAAKTKMWRTKSACMKQVGNTTFAPFWGGQVRKNWKHLGWESSEAFVWFWEEQRRNQRVICISTSRPCWAHGVTAKIQETLLYERGHTWFSVLLFLSIICCLLPPFISLPSTSLILHSTRKFHLEGKSWSYLFYKAIANRVLPIPQKSTG